MSTNFYDDGIPKQSVHCICLSVILINSVFKMGKSYCPQLVVVSRLVEYKKKYSKMLIIKTG